MLNIVTAEQRLAKPRKVTMAIFGESGAGKTTQARTLDPNTTLFVDLEAGTLALEGWAGSTIDVRSQASQFGSHPWEFARALALYISGPDPSDKDGPYSRATYDMVAGVFGDPANLNRYTTVFVDSITVASRMAFSWAQTQPAAFSEKTGKPDNRGAYGLLGVEMIRWLTQLQHAPKSIIVVGILDKVTDDLKRVTYSPQIEGSKAGRELPGLFDQIATLTSFPDGAGGNYRAFVCQKDNPWGLPAKDRSGCLAVVEPPNLGELVGKIHAGKRLDAQILTTIPTLPQTPPQTQTQTTTAA